MRAPSVMMTSSIIRIAAGEIRQTFLDNRTPRTNYPALERLHSLANELNLYDIVAAEKADQIVELAEVFYKEKSPEVEPFDRKRVFTRMLSIAGDISDIANLYEERGF